MNNFYIHLVSNTPNQIVSGNNIANFITKLPKKINLSDLWEVALTEISYTKSWYNYLKIKKLELLLTNLYQKQKY